MPIGTIEETLTGNWIETHFISHEQNALIISSNNVSLKQDVDFTFKAIRNIYQSYLSQAPLRELRRKFKLMMSLRWSYLRDSNLSYQQCPGYFVNRVCLAIANSLFIESDKAICQVLMPDIEERSPNDGLTLKEGTETEEDGFNPKQFFLTSSGKLVDIESFFEYAAINTDYVFSELQDAELSEDKFHLTPSEIGELSNIAGDKSKAFMAKLYSQHLLKHQEKNLYSQLKILKSACFQASVKASGEELEAYLPACEEVIANFYQFWISLSQAQRDRVKELKISHSHHPLESYLLVLFSRIRQIELHTEEIERVQRENILQCLHLISETIDVFCNQYTEEFIAIKPLEKEESGLAATALAAPAPTDSTSAYSRTSTVQDILANISDREFNVSTQLDGECIALAKKVYVAFSSRNTRQCLELLDNVSSQQSLLFLLELIVKNEISINERQRLAIIDKFTEIIGPLSEHQQKTYLGCLFKSLKQYSDITSTLIPSFLLDNFATSYQGLELIGELNDSPGVQLNYINYIVVPHLKFKYGFEVVSLLNSINDDIWLEVINQGVHDALLALLARCPHELHFIITGLSGKRRSQFLCHANLPFSEHIDLMLDRTMAALNDDDAELLLAREGIIEHIKASHQQFIRSNSFILQPMSKRRFRYLISKGFFSNRSISYQAFDLNNEDYLNQLSSAYLELIQQEAYQPSSLDEYVTIIRLIRRLQDDSLIEITEQLLTRLEITTIQQLIDCIKLTDDPAIQLKLIQQHEALFITIPTVEIIKYLKEDSLKEASLINLLTSNPLYQGGREQHHRSFFYHAIFANLERLPNSLRMLLSYVPQNQRLNFLYSHPELMRSLLTNTNSLIICFKSLDAQDKVFFLKRIIASESFSQENALELTIELIKHKLFNSPLTVLLHSNLNAEQLASLPELRGKNYLIEFKQAEKQDTPFALAKHMLIQYCSEYTFSVRSFFGHPHFRDIQLHCAASSSLENLIERIFTLPQDSISIELKDFMRFICELNEESFDTRYTNTFETSEPATPDTVTSAHYQAL